MSSLLYNISRMSKNNGSKKQNPEEIFSRCIRHLREEHELTQAELAENIGISRQSINAIEKGRSLPSIDLVFDFANFFNKSLDEMLEFNRQIDKIHDQILTNFSPGGEIRKEQNMSELTPWRPFRDMVSLREAMDKLFEDSFISGEALPSSKISANVPIVDMYETDKDIIAEAHVPGYSEKDINVEVDEKGIYITGEKKIEQEEKKKNYYFKESSFGKFSRGISFPVKVKSDKANADFDNGVLKITIPKALAPKSKTIRVQINKK